MKFYLKGIGFKTVISVEWEWTYARIVVFRSRTLWVSYLRCIVRSSLEECRARPPSLLYTYPMAPFEVKEWLYDMVLPNAVSVFLPSERLSQP